MPSPTEISGGEAFAARNVNEFRVGSSDGDGADRLRQLRIEDGRPDAPEVIGFPGATVDGADVRDGGLACDAGARVRAPRNEPNMRQRISR
jgi:hypothetical protein